MARRDDVLGVTGADTVIGAGVTVKGALTSESDMVIDGLVEGNITAAGDVTVGVNGRIKGNIQGLNVTVAGELDGNVRAEGEATVRETGKVTGDVAAAGLTISSGGLFSGRSTIVRQRELDLPTEDEA